MATQSRPLGAGLAVTILCGYVAAQFAGGALVGLLWWVGGGQPSPERLQELSGPAALTGMLCAGAFLWFAVRSLGSERLRDTSERGIGWVRGDAAGLWLGSGAGALVAAVTFAFALVWFPPEPGTPLGPMTELSSTPGPGRVYVGVIALALAPFLEELLFRGVLFAGLSASWGRVPAAGVTTLAFVALHATELLFYWAAGFGIVALATLALWLRLRFGALGPAVAAHLTYNAVLVTIGALAT